MKKNRINMPLLSMKNLAQGAMIAAIYVVLTYLFNYISFGPIQFRVSEILCVLPYFTPAAIPGLFVGCALSNCIYWAPFDIVFGSFATLLGAVGSYWLKKYKFLVPLPPIIANALIIPFVLRYAYGTDELIPYMMAAIGISEFIIAGIGGTVLIKLLERYRPQLFSK